MATWTQENIAVLLDLYDEKPCLYNTMHKDYHNRDMRRSALAELSTCGFPG